MTPTVRRHPRTLAEAWQRPPAPSGGAFGVLGPYRRRRGWAWRVAGWVACAVLIGAWAWVQRKV